MDLFSKRHKRGQRWSITQSKPNNQHSRSESPRGHRRAGNKSECWTRPVESELQNHSPRRGVSVHYNVHGSGHDEPNCDPKRDHSNQRHGYHKYLYAVIALLVSSPVSAADVGGVSATANPIANSSGSVTNQAIQVLQGPYITNQYGGGVACQGPTANITPFVTHSRGYKDPFETRYMEPQYDARDFEGRMVEVQKNVKNWPWESWYDNRTYTNAEGEEVRAYEDGADMTITVMEMQGDGIPDNPGDVIWEKPIRTGQQDNYSTNIGFSATLSFPLDGGLQERCKAAAEGQIEMQRQLIANKRLDFELARLKNCGQLMQQGISFKPGTKYHAICADVLVQNVNTVAQHSHTIPSPSTSVLRGSSPSVQQSSPNVTIPGVSYPVRKQSSSIPSSQSVSPLLTPGQQEVLRAVPRSLPPRRSMPSQ